MQTENKRAGLNVEPEAADAIRQVAAKLSGEQLRRVSISEALKIVCKRELAR